MSPCHYVTGQILPPDRRILFLQQSGARIYCSLANSALACRTVGMSGSASFRDSGWHRKWPPSSPREMGCAPVAISYNTTPNAQDLGKYDILPLSVGTDPALALQTRRGTGYKVPFSKGLWYRGMFPRDGACAELEDWFDPRRHRTDYIPTGFKGYGVQTRAVPGHPFGLQLSDADRAALIAFLRTV